MKKKRDVINFTLLSVIGIILILVMAFVSPSNSSEIEFLDLFFVGGAFIIICSCGFILALKPNLLRKFKWQLRDEPTSRKGRNEGINFSGHHPDCDCFQLHTLRVRDGTYCAGCTGLAIGSVISIILMGLFLIFQISLPERSLQLFVTGGLVVIILNYIETIYKKRIALLHVISNIAFVSGFLAIVLGTYMLSGRVIYGFFAIVLSSLFLFTRMRLSSWHHSRICDICNRGCKAY